MPADKLELALHIVDSQRADFDPVKSSNDEGSGETVGDLRTVPAGRARPLWSNGPLELQSMSPHPMGRLWLQGSGQS